MGVSCIASVQLTRPIKMKYLIVLSVLLFAQNVTAEAKIPERDGKFLSMFNIVRFPNDACDAGGSRNGTCYTKEECSSLIHGNQQLKSLLRLWSVPRLTKDLNYIMSNRRKRWCS